MALSALPRGGGDGDAIRMGILHIMRENGIREGHRPVSPALLLFMVTKRRQSLSARLPWLPSSTYLATGQ